MKEKTEKLLDRIATIVLWTIGGFFALAVLYFGNWIFVSDKFIVPSDSMTPTLIPGDRIVVNKLIFGARIYKNFDFSEGQPLVSWRMPGFRKIKPNDVLVFNAIRGYDRPKIEFKINYVYSKRCIGIPGDSVSIKDGFYHNSRYDGIIGVISEQQLLASTPDSLIPEPVLYTIPNNGEWTIRNFGPLWVPAKGATMRLDKALYEMYKPVIEYETGKELSIVDGGFRLDGQLLSEYVFEQNYYFVGGDNVLNSADSRYQGFLPEEFIIGVAKRIVYSRDRQTDKFRWERIWRQVDKDLQM